MHELVVTHNAGVTSCLTYRLHQIVQFRARENRWPASVDSHRQFVWYRSRLNQPIDARLILDTPALQPDFQLPVFDHNHQYAAYADLDPNIYPVARHYCHPSIEVQTVAASIAERMAGRTAVLYRGNDKVREAPRVSYEAMFDAAQKVGGPYWVQTDEEEFRAAFYDAFPDSDRLSFLPTIKRNHRAVVIGHPRDRPLFAVRFLAALYAMRQAEKLVVTTGNTSLWAVLWRGHAEGVIQQR